MFFKLDPFGNCFYTQTIGQSCNRAHNCERLLIAFNISNKELINFNLVQGKVLNVTE